MTLLSKLSAYVVLLLAASCLSTASLHALSIPSAPPLDRPIVDQTSTLSDQQITDISSAINQGRTEKSYQLAVLIIPTLDDESLEEYSLDVARTWGVGEKTVNNGVLLLIAKDDRKLRIEVGNGLEGDLTDAESSRIIRNTIAPEFKNNNYYTGIKFGVQSIQAQVEGTASSNADAETGGDVDVWAIVQGAIFFGFAGLSWLGSIFGRSKSWWAGGLVGGVIGGLLLLLSSIALWSLILLPVLVVIGLLFDWFVSRNYKSHRADGTSPAWWAGGGYGSGSGGGSFGGGGFSGGGSSGSW